MQQALLKKNYFIWGKYNKKDSVIIYTILFNLVTRYFIWYNNKGGHRPDQDSNGGSEVKLTLKSINLDLQETKKQLQTLIVIVNNINTKLDNFIEEQRKFNKKVEEQFNFINNQFRAHGWIN